MSSQTTASTDLEAVDGAGRVRKGYHPTRFRADSALLRELGERLVGKPHIALAELIKNSYDADATECRVEVEKDRIVVSDNGHGMTKKEFLDHWMTIGTRNKQASGTSRILGRNVTGSKGVGRLSAQFLAHGLEIVTAPIEKTKRQVRATVDWDAAIEARHLTEAKAYYRTERKRSEFPGRKRHGTRVVMKGIKQQWDLQAIRDLGRQIWMIQSPIKAYHSAKNGEADPNAFKIRLSSGLPGLEKSFDSQMTAALTNYIAVISGELKRDGAESHVHVKVAFSSGEEHSERFTVDPLVTSARWEIRVFKLVGRQAAGIDVQTARSYFRTFGGVHVYDAGFRLPYYGVEQDWLGVEFDHSHRRNRSQLLPGRLHVRRALNDLPTQGRLFGVVRIDTGREARTATEEQRETGEFLKIQVTRDRLVANKSYDRLRNAVRWSLDYYATRQRLREQQKIQIVRVDELASDQLGRIVGLVSEATVRHPQDETLSELFDEVESLSSTMEKERQAEDIARSLLSPLATAGMAALALEHESRKEIRQLRRLLRRLRSMARKAGASSVRDMANRIDAWIDRVEGTRKLFAPLLDVEDREETDALYAPGVIRQVVGNVRPLIPGIAVSLETRAKVYLPPATFAEWNALFQNVLINAANAMVDVDDKRIRCICGRTARAAWIRIEDSGAGIDLEYPGDYFEPFSREMRISEERQALGLGGMGLGLTIVRMIADRRRARVTFIEPSPGWRTAFQISWSTGE